MPLYAQYDPSSSISPVSGWYDTDALTYPNLPLASDLLEVTKAQWVARGNKSWAVSDGTLIEYTPPPVTPSVSQQAAALLSAGLAISSASTPALNGTYATDATSQQHISAEVTSILLNGTFADGAATVAWLDVAGGTHTFTVAQFKTFASAVAAFVAGCLKVINGQSTTLPAATATIP